jgi:diaminopimelate decarboxylase
MNIPASLAPPPPVRIGADLWLGGCNLAEVAATFGTPLFVVQPRQIGERLRQFEDTFAAAGLQAAVFFSVKTNPLPVVLEELLRWGAGAEVVSEDEYELVRRIGFPAERIVVNGPVKSTRLLRRAVREGVAMVNVEGLDELLALRDVVREHGQPVNTGLRVNPGFRSWRFSPSRSTAAYGSAMGFGLDEEDLVHAIDVIAGDPLLRFRGLHLHIGSGIASAGPYAKALARVLGAAHALLHVGLPLDVVDLGGGFGLSSARPTTAWEMLRMAAGGRRPKASGGHQPDETAVNGGMISEVAQICADQLRAFAAAHDVPVPTVFIEPGRSLSGPAQHLLLSVRRLRRQEGVPTTAFCDRGAMSLSPLLLGEHHEVTPARLGAGPVRRYRVVGNLPTPLDLVATGLDLPELQVGDVLVVHDVGAYFTTVGNTFGGPRPGVVAVEEGVPRLVRRPETLDDLLARETTRPNVRVRAMEEPVG